MDRVEQHPRWRRLGWLYAGCAMVWAATAVGPIAGMELGGIPLAVVFLASLNFLWPSYGPFFRRGLVLLILAWAGWMALTLLWTPSIKSGVWEMASLRFAWTLAAAWPLVRYRRGLTYALAAGFLLTNLSQLVLWLGHTFDLPWLMFKPWHPRNAGWWPHAAVCGYMLAAALGLHLPVLLMGRGWGRARVFARVGCGASVMGMVATGTRGAWIAGAGLVVVTGLVAVVTGRWSRRALIALAVAATVAVSGIWLAAGDVIARRAQEGYAEVRSALVEGQYETDTGARLKFARWAVQMGLRHPLAGQGAGGYEHWVRSELARHGIDADSVRTAPQAHNLWLHAFGTLGLTGLGIAVAIALAAVRGAAAPLSRANLGTIDAAPAFALLGLLLTTPFDVAYVNSPPSALLAVLFALSLLGWAQRSVPRALAEKI